MSPLLRAPIPRGWVSWILAMGVTACASAGRQSASSNGGSSVPEEIGGMGGSATAGRDGSGGNVTPDVGVPAVADAAITIAADARTADGSGALTPDVASGGAGGGGGPVGPKHVVVLIGAASDPKDATNSMMAILAGMKESDGIIAEKGVDSVTTAATVANKALVIIGPNSEAYMGKVSPTLKDATVPILISKDHLGPTLASAGSFDDHTPNDQNFITIIDAAHPLAAGLPAGDAHVYVPGNRVIYGVQLGPDAIKIATVKGHPDQWSIFAYEKGATMVGGFKAPARRVGFFWHRPPDVTEEGKKLFRAAVRWALQP
jgi:hypothetical protein